MQLRISSHPGIMPILLLGYNISLFCIICQTSNMKTVLKKTSIDTTKQTLILALDYFENNTLLTTT